MRFEDVAGALTPGRLAALPGPAAQARLAPRPRTAWVPGRHPSDARSAAGLVLLYPVGDAASLLLTVRSGALPQHAGQVSLPGGAVHPGESIEEAALREAHEEVALDPRHVVVRGRLTPLHIPVSGFVLTPVIGTAAARPDFFPAVDEVSRVLEVPIERLARATGLAIERRETAGATVEVPVFRIDGERLWGATAMVVAELLAVLGVDLDPWD